MLFSLDIKEISQFKYYNRKDFCNSKKITLWLQGVRQIKFSHIRLGMIR